MSRLVACRSYGFQPIRSDLFVYACMQIADVHVRMLHTNTMARGVVFMPWLDAIVLLKVHIHVDAYVVVSLL